MLVHLRYVPFLAIAVCGCTGDTATPAQSKQKDGEASSSGDFQMGIQSASFGQLADGTEITRYTLTNDNGMAVSVINYGAIVTSVIVPDRNGDFANVVLGFESLAGYLENSPYFGAICGRYANRIRNGKFTLHGQQHSLATNNGPNHLHGGIKGFDKVVWNARPLPSDAADGRPAALQLDYTSAAGEEGYPGELTAQVVYELTNDNQLRIEYTARATKATPVNLTNHAYWNLAGDRGGEIYQHQLTLFCDTYLPVDETLIPNGELKPVAGTAMDFKSGRTIGSRIDDVGIGYDHCYVVNRSDSKPAPAARVFEPNSGRVMTVATTEPGVQFYSGNYLDGTTATGGYTKHGGFCLECQHFPDSPNQPSFPNTILEPGQVYRQTTVHTFSIE